MAGSSLRHERLEELIAVQALGGLDPADRKELALEMHRHGPECAECRRLVSDYAEVAGMLALDLVPEAVTMEEEDRLIQAARAGAPKLRSVPDQASPAVASPARGAPQRARRWVGFAAAAASIAVLGGLVGYALAPGPSGPLRAVALSPAGGAGESASHTVAFQEGTGVAWLIGSDIPAPPEGEVYQQWFRGPDEEAMRPSNTFVPTGGRVLVPADLDGVVELLAVSVDPRGGSEGPTGPVLVQASV